MKSLSFLLVIFLGIYAQAQTSELKVNLYQKEGRKIGLAPGVANEKYFNGNSEILKSIPVKDKKITFKVKKAKDKFIYPFKLIIPDARGFYISEDVYLDSTDQSVTMGNIKDSMNYDITYTNENSLIAKEVVKFETFYKDILAKSDSLNEAEKLVFQKYGAYDKIPQDIIMKSEEVRTQINEQETLRLLEFIRRNPKSFVGFWQLVKRFQGSGYKPVYEEMYSHLSKDLKETYPGKVLGKGIRSAKILAIGQKFPVPKVTTIDQKPVVFKIPEAKITLVDFWFSHCAPCREETPKLVELYNKYKNKGFEIVSIATDVTKAVPHLKKTVREDFNMSWANYLDENSKQASEWTVTYFPSKFLLDENRVIVQKDISMEDLEKLLAEKLK
ncbi:TlpA family protein disulfide reductase [Elizabethkingia meningoseptica]|uniref:TlpA family protein disulfide reductase n=1 Tax=Elizabethkingia meningoseptica TaxID=238 RepID=UPI0023B1A967|nr:TlpA disulfide reductase family protein [Elizabethkingia meningoseptica]MDE5468730.1 TlpA family protein disulfide reductase [Elizabethkingia meningoseptica]MDE5476042.1 TlpA family protein disulfide reductase [Elizabethkingia meningoseptica]MDE5478977.1 TlpA family protein disulfide reductase [Elizabethkingia meningoseptica]MDE5484926.1 TlpA family protein disulfide reductase [Elizabethkingia meningoseptica]MDE5502378.1 TlpA family protein disulfide reductase [Elizabethkingia meningoseptic